LAGLKAPAAAAAAPAPVRTGRLWTIDALRGVAALGVVMFHASSVPGIDRSNRVEWSVDFLLNNGRYGVWLFFVISGFCIHLRWAARVAAGEPPKPDFIEFWKRRFRRLYPPYLAALVIYIALRLSWGDPLTGKFVRDVVLHLLLIQNNVPGGSNAINEVFWTLAIEEQLYLLYFVFLAIRTRFGWAATLLTAIAARVAWFGFAFVVHRALGSDIVVTQMAFVQWIVWILGALSVEAWFGLITLPAIFHRWWAACVVLIAAGAASHFYLYVLPDGAARDLLWLTADVIWAVGFFILMNAAIRAEASGGGTIGRWLARTGLFSYSLYLTHEIVTQYGWRLVYPAAVQRWGLISNLVLIPALTIASLLLARAFFTVAERPFLRGARVRQLERA
jgi:peptidoglycan/LPS O-acetylase OafA/YrhL